MNRTFDPFDELAAMFLTTPSAPQQRTAEPPQVIPHPSEFSPTPHGARAALPLSAPSAAPSRAPIAELLVTGNLPVRGGLWMTPYADSMARNAGATALIRLEGGQVTLQLLRASDELQRLDDSMTLEQTIAVLANYIDLWIIRADSERYAPGFDRLTILTSADEAAVVAAYQMIKELAQAAEPTGRIASSINLAVVGADPQAAAGVADRLSRTTASFLGVDVKLSICLQRIDAGVKSTHCLVFPNHAVPSLSQVMTWIDQAKASAAANAAAMQPIAGKLYADRIDANVMMADDVLHRTADPASQSQSMTFPPRAVANAGGAGGAAAPPAEPLRMPHFGDFGVGGASQFDLPAGRIPPPLPSRQPQPTLRAPSFASPPPVAPPPANPTAMPPLRDAAAVSRPPLKIEIDSESFNGEATHAAAPAARVPIKLAPKPTIDIEPKSRPTEPDDHGKPISLSSHIQGLTALPVRCPAHERIEIATDSTGRIHLLCREQSLRELPIVENWVKAHRELIAMACPQLVGEQGVKLAQEATCHVFTDKPTAVADLHNTTYRLHVLAPVMVNGQTGWYCAPLNVR